MFTGRTLWFPVFFAGPLVDTMVTTSYARDPARMEGSHSKQTIPTHAAHVTEPAGKPARAVLSGRFAFSESMWICVTQALFENLLLNKEPA